ncbi:MAG TPA: ABC transporter substrate-binding protein [Acidimicrobiales bacterium]|nr:ABC transporter substrate-binding protein [Acidimicrobiales bacterium]
MFAALLFGLLGSGTIASASQGAHSSGTNPRHGGSLTVLEWTGYTGSWPGLDPATDTNGAADQSYMNAIFGQLFELGPNGQTIYDLATGYKYTNGGKTIVINLRKGVKFSDGTAFTAPAVVENWRRDLGGTCSCKPVFNQTATPVVTVLSPYSLSITLQYVDASFINAMQDDIFNWIASPTALKTMGAQAFALKPVGAGPFTVVSDTPSSVLVLKKNPHYWQSGHPYLNTLTFKSVANDEAAYEAMLAGTGQAYENLSTPQLAKSFKAHFQLTTEPSTSPYDIQLNTSIPPFNNIQARKAIYYATDAALLDQKLFGGTTPVGESFEAPAGLFYQQKVPGYIGYNLNEAKKIVTALHGLSFNLFTIQNTEAQNMDEALQTMYQAAGMKVTLSVYDLSSLISQFIGGKWQIALQTAGAYDPATGVGVAFRFSSKSPFSGVHDPHLDNLLNKASGVINPKTRGLYYSAAAAYIAKEAYGPFLFPINGYDVAAKGVGGPGLSTPLPSVAVTPAILWEDVYNNG